MKDSPNDSSKNANNHRLLPLFSCLDMMKGGGGGLFSKLKLLHASFIQPILWNLNKTPPPPPPLTLCSTGVISTPIDSAFLKSYYYCIVLPGLDDRVFSVSTWCLGNGDYHSITLFLMYCTYIYHVWPAYILSCISFLFASLLCLILVPVSICPLHCFDHHNADMLGLFWCCRTWAQQMPHLHHQVQFRVWAHLWCISILYTRLSRVAGEVGRDKSTWRNPSQILGEQTPHRKGPLSDLNPGPSYSKVTGATVMAKQ